MRFDAIEPAGKFALDGQFRKVDRCALRARRREANGVVPRGTRLRRWPGRDERPRLSLLGNGEDGGRGLAKNEGKDLLARKLGGKLDGKNGDGVRELALYAQWLANHVELLIAGGDRHQIGFVFVLADDLEAAGQFIAAVRKRLFQLQHYHRAQLLAVQGGKVHPLHDHRAHGKGKMHGGAVRKQRGSLLHGGSQAHLPRRNTTDTPAIGGGRDCDEARTLSGAQAGYSSFQDSIFGCNPCFLATTSTRRMTFPHWPVLRM